MATSKDIQLDLGKRKVLITHLKDGYGATEIARILSIDKSTVSREIKKHRYITFTGSANNCICYRCVYVKECKLKKRCQSLTCISTCKGCAKLVNETSCTKFKEIKCYIETRYPFICDGCIYLKYCIKKHYSYDSKRADEVSKNTRSESRRGINLDENDYSALNSIIESGIKKGQSPYHIVQANKEVIPVTTRTVYNYINDGLLTTKKIDLPKAVKLKKRKKLKSEYEYNENKLIDRSGRMFKDWLVYKVKNKVVNYWEMDFLGAPKSSKQIILVLTASAFPFVLLFPLTSPNQKDIKALFDCLHGLLGDDFSKIFEAIITDRDSRFNGFNDIEINSRTGEVRTRVFFCNPSVSNEKPRVENMNGQIRTVFPKGVSLENITLSQCNILSSNLNGRLLCSIDANTPYDLFCEIYGVEPLNKLGISKINSKDIILQPINK